MLFNEILNLNSLIKLVFNHFITIKILLTNNDMAKLF
jgi:hypothetical protein